LVRLYFSFVYSVSNAEFVELLLVPVVIMGVILINILRFLRFLLSLRQVIVLWKFTNNPYEIFDVDADTILSADTAPSLIGDL